MKCKKTCTIQPIKWFCLIINGLTKPDGELTTPEKSV